MIGQENMIKREKKIIAFFNFVHYEWGSDKSKGSKAWEVYK